MISLIVACAANRVIGRAGEMPWYLPADLRHFKAITMGKPIIMGRKTFRSLGRPLPGRTNIVVTRDPAFEAEGVKIAHSLEAAIEKARSQGGEIMIIGGGEIYHAALPLADRIYMTRIEIEPEGDVCFPPLDKSEWRTTVLEDHAKTNDAPAYSFLCLDRIRAAPEIDKND